MTQGLRQIDNLGGLGRLILLKLDNNAITTIENLSHLTSLTYLDLSFNQIERLQGLEALTELVDLSLYSNNIAEIEGLETLTKLQILSLGRNKIQTLSSVLKLRELKDLQSLTLKENPIQREHEYRMFILAHLQQLKYLDYSLISLEELKTATEQYQDDLEGTDERERIQEVVKAKTEARNDYLNSLKETNLLYVETLFDELFADDTEFEKLKALPDVGPLVHEFSDKVKGRSEEAKEKIRVLFVSRLQEYQETAKLIEKEREEAGKRSTTKLQVLRKMLKDAQKAAASLSSSSPSAAFSSLREDIKALREANNVLGFELMDIESEAVEACGKLVNKLESALSALLEEERGVATIFFRTVEEFEKHFHEALVEHTNQLVERNVNGNLNETELSDSARVLLADSESLAGVVTGCHDIHIGKLLKQEDKMREDSTQKVMKMVEELREAGLTKNRGRVEEISFLQDQNEQDIRVLEDRVREETDSSEQ